MSSAESPTPSRIEYRPPKRKTGEERLRLGARDTGPPLIEFWRWSASDLLSNATRGIFAEYIVARALGLAVGVRAEWDAYDLETPDGTKVEVKSSAYLQSWAQKNHSAISFGIAPTKAWNANTGESESEARRQADVYVFCVLAEKDPARVDPLDLDQWEFFVLPTRVLNDRCPRQKTIALSRLPQLGARSLSFAELQKSVLSAALDEGAANG